MKHLYLLISRGWLVLLLSFLFEPVAGYAQTPAWQSVETITQTTGSNSTVISLATDANGTIYLTGYFSGTVRFGSTTLTSAGLTDVFVAKWNPANRSFIWAQQAGGPERDYGTAVAVNAGNVYVTGYTFGTSVAFGSTTLTNSNSNEEAFVAKLADAGASSQFAWAQRIGGAGSELSRSIAVNGSSVYVAGSFSPFGNAPITEFGSIRLTSTGSYDAFIAKLTDAGSSANFVWAKRAGGLSYDFVEFMCATGNTLYVTGTFNSPSADFGAATLTNRGTNTTDVFVVKLTDAGPDAAFAAAQQLGGPADDFANSITANGNSLYLGGEFYGTTFTSGSASLTNTDVSGATSDIFVAKLTDAGGSLTPVWAYGAGGTRNDAAGAVAVRGSGVYVTGVFNGAAASFGAITVANAGPGPFSSDVFLTRLQDNGSSASYSWVQRAGGTESDFARSLALVGNQVCVGGSVRPPATFGNQSITASNSNPLGYLASLTDFGVTASTPAALLGIEVYPNPTCGHVTLKMLPMPGQKTTSILLTDALGKQVKTYTAILSVASRHTLDLTDVRPGIYALSVQVGPRQTTIPLVVQ